MTERLLTYADVAATLNSSHRTVQRLVAAGRLPAIRIGGTVRFDPDDVTALIQGTRTPQHPRQHATATAHPSLFGVETRAGLEVDPPAPMALADALRDEAAYRADHADDDGVPDPQPAS